MALHVKLGANVGVPVSVGVFGGTEVDVLEGVTDAVSVGVKVDVGNTGPI